MTTATFALIDTRGAGDPAIDPSTVIAGLSLIARHVRLAARQGWNGVVIVVANEEAEAACRRGLLRHPPSHGFAVEYAEQPPMDHGDRRFVYMRLRAVYTADELARAASQGIQPQPAWTLEGERDRRVAEERLFRSMRKSVDQDGLVSFYIFRVLSRQITRLLIGTRVSPNQVSLSAMALGIAAAVCAALGGARMFALSGALYFIGAVVDCVDGEIARLRMQGSRLGEWLDSMADEVSTYGLLTGLAVGLNADGRDSRWVALAAIGALVGVLVHIKLYADLHRMGAAIDTAQYPWFFGAPSQNTGRTNAVDQLVRWLGFLFRRDAFVTVVAVLLIANLPQYAVALLSGGVAIVFALLVVHLIVTRSQ